MTKKVILLIVTGLVSFTGAFVFAWLTNPSPGVAPDETEGPVQARRSERESLKPEAVMGDVYTSTDLKTKAMTKQQLKKLIQDIRGKMREYDIKLQGLGVRERRLQIAQDLLKEDIDNLNNLRVELASTVTNLKSERDKLLKSRLEIDQVEKVNLVSIAATYDKMDASSAGKIFTNMCKVELNNGTQGIQVDKAYSRFDDAVKILHYMQERTKAKLLAELAISEPGLAATLCQRLKQVVEGT